MDQSSRNCLIFYSFLLFSDGLKEVKATQAGSDLIGLNTLNWVNFIRVIIV